MKSATIRLSFLSIMLAFISMQFQSCKAKNKDADINTAIQSKQQSDASFAGVNATVTDGVVTLTGQCNDENCKTNAEKAVTGIDGVKKVVNNITVAAVTITQDDPLKASAQNVVSKYEGVQAEVMDGVITLRGQVKRNDLQKLMVQLNELQPKKIDNQLIIK
ncbi:MAG TPA: BON domain-containing protein [Chitinophagaceae bacterium]|jgi:osmotically-inducible protein OsmY|nr:BON domain-containing protein [Chitinophagaceae bacterium]